MTNAPLLSVRELNVTFETAGETVHAVRNLSLDLAAGETLAIVGESGSGKSVTALSIMRLVEREGGFVVGRIVLQRRSGEAIELLQAPDRQLRQIRGNEISMIFQEPMTSLNPVMTVGAQLAEVLVLHQGRSARDALGECRQLLARVRIPDPASRLSQFPHEISGGMRQRIMIAMALACQPRVLIADEPTTALDVTVQAEILALIRCLQDEIGMALIFITHDMGVVAQVADRVIVMRHGETVEENSVKTLFAAPVHAYSRALLAAVPRLGSGAPGTTPAGGPPVLEVDGLRRALSRPQGAVAAHERRGSRRRGCIVQPVPWRNVGARWGIRVWEDHDRPRADATDTSRPVVLCASAGMRSRGSAPKALRSARRNIQMIFQDPYASLNPRLSVFESVAEPLAIHHLKMSRAERRDVAADLLERVGMKREHLERYPHQFSGGQRQRLAIARAISLNPKIIVADEPVSALDVSIRAQVLDLMKQLQREMGLAYLFISHDMAVVEQMSHRVAVMYLGEIVELGPSRDVLNHPRHPYTRRLLASVPVADPVGAAEIVIDEAREIRSPLRTPGDVPRPAHWLKWALVTS